MAYSELIKNFNKIREYMRDFYVYGFKSRNDFTGKSARSYDDERRRIESWLGEYMEFRQTEEGKNIFLSIDSRRTKHNPLYKAWKAKSFTDGDITLHFLIMDILGREEKMSLANLAENIDAALSSFDNPRIFDISTIRKKLNEYEKLGLLEKRKEGKTLMYSLSKECTRPDPDILDFFSEVSPPGVIGSFLLDQTDEHREVFTFKHHYITGAIDSSIIYDLLSAIQDERMVTVEIINRKKGSASELKMIPLRIMISAQSGRQYLMAYTPCFRRITSYRIDNIVTVKEGPVAENFQELREKLNGMKSHMWGVSTDSRSGRHLEHIEFTLHYGDKEDHIPRRLEREKRIGNLEVIDKNTIRFSADVYDASELIPWIRTFICRITDISISNKELEAQFREDLHVMYRIYGMEGDENR